MVSRQGKSYLILKRYPYYDYRATTNFMIDYEIISTNEIISTPTGKFRNCILIRGIGNTKFIGDSEIGSIDINILSEEWYAKGIGLIKSVRIEETDSDLFGTTKMTQVLEGYKKIKYEVKFYSFIFFIFIFNFLPWKIYFLPLFLALFFI